MILKIFALTLLYLSSSQAFAITNAKPAMDQLANANVYITIQSYVDGEKVPGACNGTILSENIVLTAAHCLVGSMGLEQEAEIEIGFLSELIPGKTIGQPAYRKTKTVGAKEFILPATIRSQAHQGLLNRNNSIRIEDDYALIVLKENIDLMAHDIPTVNILSMNEYKGLAKSHLSYSYKGISTNYWEYNGLDLKREAFYKDVRFQNYLELEHGNLINTYDLDTYLQPTDSGSPLFVKIGQKWYLIGVGKGFENSYPYHSGYAPITRDLIKALIKVTK